MIKWDFWLTKPVFFILHGHSVKELIRRWDEFKDFDVHWFSMNHCGYLREFMKFPLDVYIWYCTHKECNHCSYRHVFSKSEARGNSPLEFVFQAHENGLRDLVFFGMDGYTPDPKVTYADGTHDWCAQNDHPKECRHFNEKCPKEMKECIINVSPGSKYDLRTMTYDEFLATTSYKKKNM